MIPYKIITGLFGMFISDFSFYLGSYIYWYFERKHCTGYICAQFVTLRKRQLCSLLILYSMAISVSAVYTKTYYTKDIILDATSIPQN